jgi:hypothetical protein
MAAAEAREIASGDSILDELHAFCSKARRLQKMAEKKKDVRTAITAIRETGEARGAKGAHPRRDSRPRNHRHERADRFRHRGAHGHSVSRPQGDVCGDSGRLGNRCDGSATRPWGRHATSSTRETDRPVSSRHTSAGRWFHARRSGSARQASDVCSGSYSRRNPRI